VEFEGDLDDSPIVLEGVDVADFRALLRFLYPKKHRDDAELSQKEWIGIHALAHMWGFEEAKEASKAFLFNMDDSITKLVLGAQYDYVDWLRKAYEDLARRLSPLSVDEAKRIGVEAAMHISHIREIRLEAQSTSRVIHANVQVLVSGRKGTYCPHCSNYIHPMSTRSIAGDTQWHRCNPCGVSFYGDKATVDGIATNRINEKLRALFPPEPEEARIPESPYSELEDEKKDDTALDGWGSSFGGVSSTGISNY